MIIMYSCYLKFMTQVLFSSQVCGEDHFYASHMNFVYYFIHFDGKRQFSFDVEPKFLGIISH
jgi:hypothetical protein